MRMKKLLFIMLSALIVTSCGSGGSKKQPAKSETPMENKSQVTLMTVDPGLPWSRR
jgi:PBP1b-binding outer membrane lipoprotein LpoB